MDSGLKHTLKATQAIFFMAEKRNFLQRPTQSSDLNPIKHAFDFMKAKPPKNTWQGVSMYCTVAVAVGFKLQAVTDCKGFATHKDHLSLSLTSLITFDP